MWSSKAMMSWPARAVRYVERQGKESWPARAALNLERQGNEKLARSGRALCGAARQ